MALVYSEVESFIYHAMMCCVHYVQSSSSLESNLAGLADVLEADLPNYKSKILNILMEW